MAKASAASSLTAWLVGTRFKASAAACFASEAVSKFLQEHVSPHFDE
jgi:hypothetical protein